MNQSSSASAAAQRVGSYLRRMIHAWRVLPFERRLAAAAAIGLFLTLFLPWYQETVIVKGRATALQTASVSVTGWGAFSFVEAAVLLVAAGVLTLLFQRAEGHAFHLPGGDGTVITAAGLWTCVLVVWRIFDKQDATKNGQFASTSGIDWGIFIALAVAAFLAYAGSRIRVAHRPEPPLPGEEAAPRAGSSPDQPVRRRRAERAVGVAAQAASESAAAWDVGATWEMGRRGQVGGSGEANRERRGSAGLAGEGPTDPLPRAPQRVETESLSPAPQQAPTESLPPAPQQAPTEPLPPGPQQAPTEPLPPAPQHAQTEPLPAAPDQAPTERLPGAPGSARPADAGPTRPRHRLADLPRPELEDPPPLRIPPRSRRSVRRSPPEHPPVPSDEQLTTPFEERRSED